MESGARVTKIDAAAHRVTDDKGQTHQYRKLLLATGGTPRKLPGAADGIIYYRTLDDYRRTRKLTEEAARFVVIGGGFIGTEIAAGIRMQQRDVTMIVPEKGLGGRVFPADLSGFLVEYYRGKGVEVHPSESVEKVESKGGRFTVKTRSSGTITADAVVAGLGIEPATDLASQAGLKVNNGIEVDEQLRTSNSDIYAAGDVANFFNPLLGKRMRVEHEDNANTMGKIAGQNMAGAGQRYDHLPFFYSDLFDLGYEAVGETDSRYQTFADWKQEFREGVIYYLDGGRVRGVVLWGIFGQVDAARAVMAERGPFKGPDLKGKIKW